MWLVAGLGNPGKRYEQDRHNAGFLAISFLHQKFGSPSLLSRGGGKIARVRIGREEVMLLWPQTYMNASGEAVAPLLKKFRLTLEQLLVVHDDLDLPLGRLLFKRGGGDAGHGGLRSISEALKSRDYLRLRIGIGRPLNRATSVVDYVLSPPAPAEQPLWQAALRRASEMIESCCAEGWVKAVNRWHSRRIPPLLEEDKSAKVETD